MSRCFSSPTETMDFSSSFNGIIDGLQLDFLTLFSPFLSGARLPVLVPLVLLFLKRHAVHFILLIWTLACRAKSVNLFPNYVSCLRNYREITEPLVVSCGKGLQSATICSLNGNLARGAFQSFRAWSTPCKLLCLS